MRPRVAHCHLGLGRLYYQTGPAGAGPRRPGHGYRDVPGDERLPQTEAALAQAKIEAG